MFEDNKGHLCDFFLVAFEGERDVAFVNGGLIKQVFDEGVDVVEESRCDFLLFEQIRVRDLLLAVERLQAALHALREVHEAAAEVFQYLRVLGQEVRTLPGQPVEGEQKRLGAGKVEERGGRRFFRWRRHVYLETEFV